MKKKTLIALITAAVLIVSGSFLLFIGLEKADLRASQEPVSKVYTAEGSFQTIRIDTGACDVRFYKTDGDLTVHVPQTERLEYIVLVEDGVLTISAMDMRQWYDFIGIHTYEPVMRVYLPKAEYESLYIQTDTGDIEIPQDFSFDTADVLTSTGDITFSAAVSGNLTVQSSSGDTQISGVNPAYLECRSSTGDMMLENVHVQGDIQLQRSTGWLIAKDVSCRNFTSRSNTGDVTLTDVLITQALQVNTTTGDVDIQNCDAATVTIETDTGDVEGNFRTPKWFITSTSTGDVDVPLSREGGECRITTSTGDITFR